MGISRRSFLWLVPVAVGSAGQAFARGGGGGGRGGASHSSGSHYGGSHSSGARGTGSNPSSHSTKGYTKKDGTYVQPHHQTNPNNTQYDNYNTRGNYNPHNGNYGTRTPKY
jgi:hypothetical protein